MGGYRLLRLSAATERTYRIGNSPMYQRLEPCRRVGGHLRMYESTNGGKFGQTDVAFFQWQFRADQKSKLKFKDPNLGGSLFKDNWNFTVKNFCRL